APRPGPQDPLATSSAHARARSPPCYGRLPTCESPGPARRDNLASMESWRRADVPALPGGGPPRRLHDTPTGKRVLAAAGPVATLYACGITPYDATHIGHAATYTAWDLLVRAWLDAMPETPDSAPARAGPPPGRWTVIHVQKL